MFGGYRGIGLQPFLQLCFDCFAYTSRRFPATLVSQWSFRGGKCGNGDPIVIKCLRTRYGQHCEPLSVHKCTRLQDFAYNLIIFPGERWYQSCPWVGLTRRLGCVGWVVTSWSEIFVFSGLGWVMCLKWRICEKWNSCMYYKVSILV